MLVLETVAALAAPKPRVARRRQRDGSAAPFDQARPRQGSEHPRRERDRRAVVALGDDLSRDGRRTDLCPAGFQVPQQALRIRVSLHGAAPAPAHAAMPPRPAPSR